MMKNDYNHGTAMHFDSDAKTSSGVHLWKTPAETNSAAGSEVKPAVAFLRENGQNALVSLGCGQQINRIDNHLRLMIALKLTYYVGIDCGPSIEAVSENLFTNSGNSMSLLSCYHSGSPHFFWKALKLFPGTFVEELLDVHCAAVVCQRVYPNCRWEKSIVSMNPLIVLQEDLHGCERQKLRGEQYVRNWSNIRAYGLESFRPWPVFPGEKNLVLWRRRDFAGKDETGGKFGWLQRIAERFIG
jgi:hypothetical protein